MDAEEGTQLAVAEWLQLARYQNPRSKVPDLELTFKAKHTNLQITLAGLTWVIGMGMQQRVSAKFPPPSEDCYLQVLASTGFIDFPQECGDGGDGWQEFCQQIISSNERIWQTPGADHEDEGLVCTELAPLVVQAIAVWRREKTLGELLDALNSLSQAFHSLTNQSNKLEEQGRVVSVQLFSRAKSWVEVEVEAAASHCRAARDRSTKAPTSTAAVLRRFLKEYSLLFRNQDDDDDDDESLAYHGILEPQLSAPRGSAAPSSSVTNSGFASGSSQCGWRNILRMLRRTIRRKAIASTERRKLLGHEDHHHSSSEELSRLFSGDQSMSAREKDVRRLPENFSGASLHLVLQRQSSGLGDDVLQWCNLEYIKDEQNLLCEFEVSAFMGDELAAASMGISFNLPLQIGLTFDLNYDTSTLQVHTKQGPAKVEDTGVDNNRHTQLGPSRLVPHIVKRYFQEPTIRETIMKSAGGSCSSSASEDNVFLGFLQHMVVALASLNMLCPCCGNFHTYSSASKLVHPCDTLLCRAQFATWVGGNQNLLELTMTPVDIADAWELELVRQELATKEAFPIESSQSLDRLQDEVSRRNLVSYETNYEHLVYAIAFMNACSSFTKYRCQAATLGFQAPDCDEIL